VVLLVQCCLELLLVQQDPVVPEPQLHPLVLFLLELLEDLLVRLVQHLLMVQEVQWVQRIQVVQRCLQDLADQLVLLNRRVLHFQWHLVVQQVLLDLLRPADP